MTQKVRKQAAKMKAEMGTKMVRKFEAMKTAEVFMTAVATLILLNRHSTKSEKIAPTVQHA